jgi:hypothetical protein
MPTLFLLTFNNYKVVDQALPSEIRLELALLPQRAALVVCCLELINRSNMLPHLLRVAGAVLTLRLQAVEAY